MERKGEEGKRIKEKGKKEENKEYFNFLLKFKNGVNVKFNFWNYRGKWNCVQTLLKSEWFFLNFFYLITNSNRRCQTLHKFILRFPKKNNSKNIDLKLDFNLNN